MSKNALIQRNNFLPSHVPGYFSYVSAPKKAFKLSEFEQAAFSGFEKDFYDESNSHQASDEFSADLPLSKNMGINTVTGLFTNLKGLQYYTR